MSVLRGIAQFWYDLIIGDDWKLAVVVALVVALGAGAVAAGWVGPGLAVALGVLLAAGFTGALLLDVRAAGRR